MAALKKFFSFSFRAVISIALIALLFGSEKIDAAKIIAQVREANWGLLIIAFLVFFANYLLCFFRWLLLLRAVKIDLPFSRIVTSFAGGIYFNLLLPSSIGGDVTRSIDLGKYTNRPREVVATVFLDRLSGYIGLVIVVVIALLIGYRKIILGAKVLVPVAIIILLLAGILLALFNKLCYAKINKFLDSSSAGKIRESLKNLHDEIHVFRHKRRVILLSIFISVAIQTIGPVTFYITALALGIKANLLYFFVFLPIIGAITLLPISLGGFGLREQMSVVYFSGIGVTEVAASTMSLLNSFYIFVFGAIGGLIYVFTVHNRRLQPHQAPSSRTP